jgi:Tol biopolymer transport system component
MRHTWRIVAGLVVVAALVGLTSATPGAGQADLADRLLQEALTKELVEQDRPAAIKLYQQVLATAGVSTATANRARERMAALQPQAPRTQAAPVVGSSPAPRRVLDGEWTELFGMSADGRLVVGQRVVRVGTQELVVRDLSTGTARGLAMCGAGPELSDDGTLAACALPNWSELNIVETESGAPRLSIVAPPAVSYRAVDFAPDGRSILIEINKANAEGPRSGPVEYAWLTLADHSLRSIRTFERWAAPANHQLEPEVSPDGRFVAFVAAPAPDTQDQYVYVMDADGQTIEPVVSASGRRGWPKWTPDSRHILFTEERGSGTGLWSVAVENGRAAGQPRLLYGNIGGDTALLGITKAGVLHYRRNDVGSGRYAGNAAHVVPRTHAATGSQQRPMTFRGCCAAWAPDGQRLAYLGGDGAVVVRRVETGEERSYEIRGAGVANLPTHPWYHDDSAVLVAGTNETSAGAAENNERLYRLDLGSGAVSPVLNVGPLRSWNAALSKDDRTLYVAKRDAPGGPFTQIVAVDIATGTERRVSALPADITVTHPEIVVSPDGTTLGIGAVVGPVWQSDGWIFTVKVDGTDFRDLGGGGLPGFWGGSPLRWTPDGRSLLFRAFDAERDWRIMRIPASGGAVEPDGVSYATVAPLVPDIRMVRSNFNGLDVSPDGSRLVVSTLVAPKFEVWAIDGVAP